MTTETKLLNVYPLYDIEPVNGKDVWIVDKKGDQYLDFYGGHAVISIGHSHPDYIHALQEQLEKLVFYSNSIINPLQPQVAESILQVSGLPDEYRLFMINSGAEAIENAIKLASFINRRKKFITLKKGFHGRTAGAIALTDGMKHKTSFQPDFETLRLDINDMDAMKKELETGEVCAVLLEPIQGIGGIHICTDEYLQQVRQWCTQTNTILIADEIQCGFGRSGKFFAFQYSGITSDIITIAKGMGNGFPVAGVLIKEGILKAEMGMAGTTFGGNHLACAATLAVLQAIHKENLMENADQLGKYLQERLMGIHGIKEIRGRGLMIGIEMDFPVADLRKELVFQHKIFTGSSSDPFVLRLLPPLTVKKSHCDILIKSFEECIHYQNKN
ncbi:MAG TPA: aminotransferase class III-fold pyridoxal phosphate-dependent enzyme [Saprospiraceae bacterium]|nr:aminotransferase class III-fold pyridoxal phosphate-dependent enzyme [Saprospiraceae bacterium]